MSLRDVKDKRLTGRLGEHFCVWCERKEQNKLNKSYSGILNYNRS